LGTLKLVENSMKLLKIVKKYDKFFNLFIIVHHFTLEPSHSREKCTIVTLNGSSRNVANTRRGAKAGGGGREGELLKE
jgi:hypothetical protein